MFFLTKDEGKEEKRDKKELDNELDCKECRAKDFPITSICKRAYIESDTFSE